MPHCLRTSAIERCSLVSFQLKETKAPSQYPKWRLSVRSRKVSKPRDLYLELFDRSEIWQALRQQCCRCACQISKWYDNLKYNPVASRLYEILRKDVFLDIETGARRQQLVHLVYNHEIVPLGGIQVPLLLLVSELWSIPFVRTICALLC